MKFISTHSLDDQLAKRLTNWVVRTRVAPLFCMFSRQRKVAMSEKEEFFFTLRMKLLFFLFGFVYQFKEWLKFLFRRTVRTCKTTFFHSKTYQNIISFHKNLFFSQSTFNQQKLFVFRQLKYGTVKKKPGKVASTCLWYSQ